MGEGVGSVGPNVQAAAAAAQASEDIKKKAEKEKVKEKKKATAGLKLEGLPKEAETKVEVADTVNEKEEVAGAEAPEAAEEVAETILSDMDKQLENIQKGLKDFIGKKIRLAAQNPPRSKELLRSAYNDTKKAYDKIKKVREQLS